MLSRTSYLGEFLGRLIDVTSSGGLVILPDSERPDRTGVLRLPVLDLQEVLGPAPEDWLEPWGRVRCRPQRLFEVPPGVLRHDGIRWWILNKPERGWGSSGLSYATLGEALTRWSLTLEENGTNVFTPSMDAHGTYWSVRGR